MKLKFLKHEKPNRLYCIKMIEVRSEREAMHIVANIDFPTETTAISLTNMKTRKEGFFYKNTSDGVPMICWWEGYGWDRYRDEFAGKKRFYE